MGYLPLALCAYFLNSIAVVADKLLLSKKDTDPALYVFYVSAFSLVSLVFIPATHIPGINTLILASTSTLLWTAGAYYMFRAIQIANVARVIPVIGATIPLVLSVYALIQGAITPQHLISIGLLIGGLIALTAPDWRGHVTKKELLFETASVLLFAFSYIILRQAYLQDEFFSVFVWSRPILIILGAIMLAVPVLRKKIITPKSSKTLSLSSKYGLLFLAGQMAGGASELLLTFSISLADPSLVNSLQGTQYIFLIILSFALARQYPDIFRDGVNRQAWPIKFFGIGLTITGLYLLAFVH